MPSLRFLVLIFLIPGGILRGWAADRDESISQDELVRRTQEILNGVRDGDPKAFERYFSEDSVDHDEKGRGMDKKTLLADITPPPPHWSGSITIKNPESRIEGNAAILSYEVDESETFSGQTMYARYHTTDTWLRREGQWQIVAEQVMRYYEDPAIGKTDPKKYVDYVGTYELSPGNFIDISRVGRELFYQKSGKPRNQLFVESGDLFFRKDVEGRILFHRNEKNAVDGLVDRRNNEDIVWRKTK